MIIYILIEYRQANQWVHIMQYVKQNFKNSVFSIICTIA